jgi:hypothetical protein
MKQILKNIIESKIPKGFIFDAHSIIDYLIQYESDAYLSFYKKNWKTDDFHREISKLIAEFEDTKIERQGKSWSRNIHNKFTKNICWLKK